MFPSHDEMVSRLCAAHEDAKEGHDWYWESRRFARQLSREHDVTMAQSAGVIAGMSPNTGWKANKTMARAIVSGSGRPGFKKNVAKCERILAGERPLSVLTGPKVRAFYRAIMGDETAAVIDIWMLRAAGWPRDTISPSQYERVASALREAASLHDMGVATFQARVWNVVRTGDK